MEYELRHFDEVLLRFEANKDSSDPAYRITWANKEAHALLPYGFDSTPRGVAR